MIMRVVVVFNVEKPIKKLRVFKRNLLFFTQKCPLLEKTDYTKDSKMLSIALYI